MSKPPENSGASSASGTRAAAPAPRTDLPVGPKPKGFVAPAINAAQTRVYREHIATMGIRDAPRMNAVHILEQPSTLGGMSPFPHASPVKGETPAHLTDIRRDPVAQGYTQMINDSSGNPPVQHNGTPYTIHQRFHRHITGNPVALGEVLPDRYLASSPAPNGGGYEVRAATVNAADRTVTVMSASLSEFPLSPRSQGR